MSTQLSLLPEAVFPRQLSVTALVELRRCPRRFAFAEVEGHRRRPPEGATLGAAVHRGIYLSHRLPPQASLPVDGEAAALVEAFRSGPFARRRLVAAELPIRLRRGELTIVGRVDAVFAGDDDPEAWELVDFKSGGAPAELDPADEAQLEIYALAAITNHGRQPDKVTTTYLHLSTCETRSRRWSAELVARAEADLASDLARIVAGDYPARVNRGCAGCDALEACPPGQQRVSAGPG